MLQSLKEIHYRTTLMKGWMITMEIYYIYILMRCMSDGDNGMVEMHDNNGSGGSGVGGGEWSW